LGYFAALDFIDKQLKNDAPLTEEFIKTIHALVMGGGKKQVPPSPYRDGQNVIKESGRGGIVYLPPEACDVSALMKDLICWLSENHSNKEDIPCSIKAGIAHYQFCYYSSIF
jgi:Fic family protein